VIADESHSGPFSEADAASAEPTSARQTCDDNSDDPCATQEDKDEALAEAVALQADLDSLSSRFSAAADACASDAACSGDGAPSSGPAADSGCEAGGCLWYYVAAVSGVAWGVSGIAFVVAAAISPDPVSKLTLVGLWGNAVAGVTAAVAAVGFAYDCHYAPPAKLEPNDDPSPAAQNHWAADGGRYVASRSGQLRLA
jgi:hypothetical protein